MEFQLHRWQRLEWRGLPLYLNPEQPCWFVPNACGDRVLRDMFRDDSVSTEPAVQRFLQRLPRSQSSSYPGRSHFLKTDELRELWFHVTNRCNMRCRHCMFGSGPADTDELDAARVVELARQASDLGCRVFALTGGEPLVHRRFEHIAREIMALPDSRLVLLTNGLLLSRLLPRLSCDPARLHLQISVDGLRERHDRLRGAGSYDKLKEQLNWLRRRRLPFTLSMCVTADNVSDMPAVVDFAARHGAENVHFMWYFSRGRGGAERAVDSDRIIPHLLRAQEVAEQHGIAIDNLQALKTQVFAPPGTVHDGSNNAWESLAVGPDGQLYPSAALVGAPELATAIGDELACAWRNSPVLDRIRRATAAELSSPWRFLLGGGDLDHSYLASGRYVGGDPYLPLYEQIVCWLIKRHAQCQEDGGPPRLRLKMGDILESCGAHGAVALLHSNCLLSLAGQDSHAAVKDYYRSAATEDREEILNPVCYDEALIAHIPEKFRFRGYGCGSPVLDAQLQPGETVVDLGSGRGVECFIAARQVGARGKAIGIDMLDPMLTAARNGAEAVSANLGYRNLEFRRGYLESMPLEDASVDVVLSNCVMNLSPDKRRAFSEILRVLRPGGRLVISDVVCEEEPDAVIRNDEILRGECIGGALSQRDLVGILEETGFAAVCILKRFPYRVVGGHPFFSLTYQAVKAAPSEPVRVLWRGPLSTVTSDGALLVPGSVSALDRQHAELAGEAVFQLDEAGAVTNLDLGESCCCSTPPESRVPEPSRTPVRYTTDCMVCGAPLLYLDEDRQESCHFCKTVRTTRAVCSNGHYVCDTCHAEDARQVIERACTMTKATDMLELFEDITAHPSFPDNGPEYHALVPGIILATARNLGMQISQETVMAGIRRGAQVVGGSCAFWGVCGAATGVGMAFSLLLEANPLKAAARQAVQTAVKEVLAEISALPTSRCCRRDTVLALRKAAQLSAKLLPVTLTARNPVGCPSHRQKDGCLGGRCPLMKEFRLISSSQGAGSE
jgi:MoaA/NifB/PqqE/SkfB family radical SAM enzyme/SAM-dependent methyltransferase